MELKLTYNSLVNSVLMKLGERTGLTIEVAERNKEVAKQILEKSNDMISVRMKFLDDVVKWQGPVRCLGVTIAKATDRDSGAVVPKNVTLIDGEVDSTGSMKNWKTIVYKDSIVECDVPRFIYDKFKDSYEDIEITLAPTLNIDDLINQLKGDECDD